jgi:hypothetical protein
VSSNEITDEEMREILEEQAQRNLHLSLAEFLDAWRAGKIENPDRPEVIDLLLLIPGAWR